MYHAVDPLISHETQQSQFVPKHNSLYALHTMRLSCSAISFFSFFFSMGEDNLKKLNYEVWKDTLYRMNHLQLMCHSLYSYTVTVSSWGPFPGGYSRADFRPVL